MTNMLRDPDRDRTGANPPGTNLATQERLRALRRFPEVHQKILGKILSEPVFTVMCNHGIHRSVGAVELAVEDANNLREIRLDIEVIHVDLEPHRIDDALWSRLCTM